MYGAACATIMAFLFKAIATFLVSNRYYHLHVEIVRIVKLLLSVFAIYAVCDKIVVDSTIAVIAIKTLLVLTLPFVLWTVRFYAEDEVAKARLVGFEILYKIKAVLSHR